MRNQAGFADGREVALDLQGVVRRKLHDSSCNARLLGQFLRQFGINLEAQHIARCGLEQFAGVIQRHDSS